MKGGADAHLGFNADVSVVISDDGIRDGQSHAHSPLNAAFLG